MRKDVIIKTSSGGMTNDQFARDAGKAHILQHFDVFTDPYRMIPHLSAAVGDSSASTNQIRNFAFDGTTIYGLGQFISGGQPLVKVFTRTDFTGSTWTAASLQPGIVSRDAAMPFFTYYRTTGRLYGAGYGDTQDYIWSWKADDSAATQADGTIGTFTNISNGLVHSKDDILYVGIDNKIAAKNGSAAWNMSALTLPDNYAITQLSEFGNYLAIGCRHLGGGNSRVFLWDRDTSLATVSETIDWGPGNLMILEQDEGYLLGVSFEGDVVGGAIITQTRVTFRQYAGGASGAVKFDEFTGYSTSPAIESTLFKQKYRNRILFPARIPIATTGYDGIWSIGRASSNAPFSVTLEYLYSDTGTPSTRYGLLQVGDTLFSAYAQRVSGSDVMHMDKTDDAGVYDQTSARETLINPGMDEGDRDLRKQLIFGGLSYEPLPSGAQAVLKYRVDGGAWQTIFTEAMTGQVVTEKIISGLIGRNFEFRDESTGGAVITGLRYKYDTLSSNI